MATVKLLLPRWLQRLCPALSSSQSFSQGDSLSAGRLSMYKNSRFLYIMFNSCLKIAKITALESRRLPCGGLRQGPLRKPVWFECSGDLEAC